MKQIPDLANEGRITKAFWGQFKNILNANFRECMLQPGVGYNVTNSPGGQSLKIKGAQSSLQSESTFPFKCTLYPQFNTDGTPNGAKVGVEFNSILFKSLIPLVEFSGITGLNDPDSPYLLDLEGPDDPSTSTGINDYVFLEIKFQSDGVTIDTVAIETHGNGNSTDPTYDAWDDSGDALVARDTATPPKQTYARIVIATYKDGILQQNVMGNLVMIDMAIDGQATRYPVPY